MCGDNCVGCGHSGNLGVSDCLQALGARIATMCWESLFSLSLSLTPTPPCAAPHTQGPAPHMQARMRAESAGSSGVFQLGDLARYRPEGVMKRKSHRNLVWVGLV